MTVHPLIFQPIFKQRIWGDRNMESRLGKSLPPGPIGESWELSDLEHDQSVVADGPQKGKSLSQIVQLWGADLLGEVGLIDGRFPLLLKFLDAQQPLSVQVHPTEDMLDNDGARFAIKNEAWYVIDAIPQAWMLRGVKPGMERGELEDALVRGDIERALNRVPLRPGHAYYLPAGTVHALGPGALIAEVQTPSDTTFRLYDWGRVDPDTGKTRELHIEPGLQAVRLEPVPPEAEHPEHLASVWTAVTRLIQCEWFVIERVRMVAGVELALPYDQMVVWMVLDGDATIRCEGLRDPVRVRTGDTVLLPAALKYGQVAIEKAATWLEVTVPVASSLRDLTLSERSTLHSDPRTSYVPLNIPRQD